MGWGTFTRTNAIDPILCWVAEQATQSPKKKDSENSGVMCLRDAV